VLVGETFVAASSATCPRQRQPCVCVCVCVAHLLCAARRSHTALRRALTMQPISHLPVCLSVPVRVCVCVVQSLTTPACMH